MPQSTFQILASASLCLAALGSGVAIAAPVTASFTGAITNLREGNNGRLSSDFPVGTAVSASVNFDNNLPGVTVEQPPVIMAASGNLRFGSAVYTVTGIRVFGRAVAGAPTVPDYWSFFIQATGPSTDDGDVFYGFLWYLNPALTGFSGAAPAVPLQAAWVTSTHAASGGPLYAANIVGTLNVQASNAVPVPPTAALALLGLAALGCTRRRSWGPAGAHQ